MKKQPKYLDEFDRVWFLEAGGDDLKHKIKQFITKTRKEAVEEERERIKKHIYNMRKEKVHGRNEIISEILFSIENDYDKTEQCFCQSYYDDNNELQDCTCGECEMMCPCGANPKWHESEVCKDCI